MTNEHPISFTNIYGQSRVNQLGGRFINGRPLPVETRQQIVELHLRGVKPCKISRDLRVSHGAVSKILNRFNETGSISPGQMGGNPRARYTIQSMEQDIYRLKSQNPTFGPTEIRQQLIEDGVCEKRTAPSVSSINRYFKSKGLKRFVANVATASATRKLDSVGSDFLSTALHEDEDDNEEEDGEEREPKNKLVKFSIESILSSDESKISTSSSNDTGLSLANSNPFSSSSAYSSSSDEENVGSPSGDPTVVTACFSQDLRTNASTSSAALADNYGNAVGVLTPQQGDNRSSPLENRRNRTSFSAAQLSILEVAFAKNIYPSAEEREYLMKLTKLDEDKIITWFSNKRARHRKMFANNNSSNNPYNAHLVNPIVSSFTKANLNGLAPPLKTLPNAELQQPQQKQSDTVFNQIFQNNLLTNPMFLNTLALIHHQQQQQKQQQNIFKLMMERDTKNLP